MSNIRRSYDMVFLEIQLLELGNLRRLYEYFAFWHGSRPALNRVAQVRSQKLREARKIAEDGYTAHFGLFSFFL